MDYSNSISYTSLNNSIWLGGWRISTACKIYEEKMTDERIEVMLHYHVEMCRAFWFLWKLVEQRRLIEKHWAFFLKQHVDLFEDQSQPRWHRMRHNQWENLRRNPWSTSSIIMLLISTSRFIFIRWRRCWSWGIRWWRTRWWIRLCSGIHRIIWMMYRLCWLLFTGSTIRFRRVMGHCNLDQRTEIHHGFNSKTTNHFSRCSSW